MQQNYELNFRKLRSNSEVAELTWENGQLATHGLGGLLPSNQAKPTWGRTNEMLESIVHQARIPQHQAPQQVQQLHQDRIPVDTMSSMVASSDSKWTNDNISDYCVPMAPFSTKKDTRPEPIQFGTKFSGCIREDQHVDLNASASASAPFCRENDATTMTWTSHDSSQRLKDKTKNEDSASQDGLDNQDDPKTKTETIRSQSSRRSRAASVHNQSERRRRDRINQKMKALQKLVPNASKTDKASMLDEVIEYLKQLQAQIQMMNTMRNMPQMMMPIGLQQQQLQMAMLARMGIGLGMGMLENSVRHASSLSLPQGTAAAAPSFTPLPYLLPSMIPSSCPTQTSADNGTNGSQTPLHDPYYAALLAQSMKMDMYNKMAAAIYQQQVSQSNQARSSMSQSKPHEE